MSKRRLITRVRRFAAVLCRGFVVLAVGAKLLVPVGYMPASLADGGPLMLCGSGLPASLLSSHEHDASGHDAASAHGHPASMHDHAGPAAEGAALGSRTGDEPASGHHEWERCSLGGLASLAAIAAEWRFEIPAVAPERAAAPARILPTRARWLAFRSRAPPVALS
jgi:hypothetical protein